MAKRKITQIMLRNRQGLCFCVAKDLDDIPMGSPQRECQIELG